MPTEVIPEYTTTPKAKSKADRAAFKIDGEIYHLRRPKMAAFARIAVALDSTLPLNDRKNMGILLGFIGEMLQYVDDEAVKVKGPDGKLVPDGLLHGRAHLEHRLADPDDALDIDVLVPILFGRMEEWTGRPTGLPRASSAPRRAPSRTRASRARTR